MNEIIDNYPDDNLVYCAEILNDSSCFLVQNQKIVYATITPEDVFDDRVPAKTDYLELCFGVELRNVHYRGKTMKSERFDFIVLSDSASPRERKSFIEICKAHAYSLNSGTLESFFYSLSTLFTLSPDQHRKNAVGLFGELVIIRAFEQLGIDVSCFWQLQGPYTKYDFCCTDANLEVKSTLSKDRVVRLKHDQIFNNDNNILVFVQLDENPSGESLVALSDELLNSEICFNSLRELIELRKEMLKVNEDEAMTRYSVKSICCYAADDINPFSGFIPDGVSGLEYKLNLQGFSGSELNSLLKVIEG